MLVVGTRRDHQGPAPVQHYKDADRAGVASAGTPAWRLGMMVVAGDTGTLGTSLLYKRAQHDVSTTDIIYSILPLLCQPALHSQSYRQLYCT
jgi:hypothetical protein